MHHILQILTWVPNAYKSCAWDKAVGRVFPQPTDCTQEDISWGGPASPMFQDPTNTDRLSWSWSEPALILFRISWVSWQNRSLDYNIEYNWLLEIKQNTQKRETTGYIHTNRWIECEGGRERERETDWYTAQPHSPSYHWRGNPSCLVPRRRLWAWCPLTGTSRAAAVGGVQTASDCSHPQVCRSETCKSSDSPGSSHFFCLGKYTRRGRGNKWKSIYMYIQGEVVVGEGKKGRGGG